MVLDLFGKSKGGPAKGRPAKPQHPPSSGARALAARGSYSRAIDLLRAELQKHRGDERLRVQLAETLALAGRAKEAAEILNALADDLALCGQAGKAIAALKKIQRIDPGRPDVEEKLSYLITHQQRPAFDPWSKAKPATSPEPEASLPRVPEFGMEEIPEEPPEAAPVEVAASAGTGEAPVPASPSEAISDVFSDDEARDQLVSMIEDVFTPVAGPSESPLGGEPVVVESPLFQDFSREELVEVIRGLRLRSFEPGEIVVSSGEPGESMFLITTGSVRAYMPDKRGHQVQVREMLEGDFFGEISVLTGNPRSATITAASYCELLELDRPALNDIARRHPRVREVLQQFYKRRASHSIEAAIDQDRR